MVDAAHILSSLVFEVANSVWPRCFCQFGDWQPFGVFRRLAQIKSADSLTVRQETVLSVAIQNQLENNKKTPAHKATGVGEMIS